MDNKYKVTNYKTIITCVLSVAEGKSMTSSNRFGIGYSHIFSIYHSSSRIRNDYYRWLLVISHIVIIVVDVDSIRG